MMLREEEDHHESSPLLLVSSTTTTQKKSSIIKNVEKKKKKILFGTTFALVVGWCSILAVASMKSHHPSFGMPRVVHELGIGEKNHQHHHRGFLRRLGESEDVAEAASLGTLPRRTWGSRSGTTTTSAPLQTSGEEESGADAPTPDAAQQQQQQQQQQQ